MLLRAVTSESGAAKQQRDKQKSSVVVCAPSAASVTCLSHRSGRMTVVNAAAHACSTVGTLRGSTSSESMIRVNAKLDAVVDKLLDTESGTYQLLQERQDEECHVKKTDKQCHPPHLSSSCSPPSEPNPSMGKPLHPTAKKTEMRSPEPESRGGSAPRRAGLFHTEEQLQRTFETLFQDHRTDFRTSRGALHTRQVVVRPPAPRTPAEKRRGREIAQRNVDAVRSPSPPRSSRNSPTSRPATGEASGCSVAKERLHIVASRVRRELNVGRREVERKQQYAESLDQEELKKKANPSTNDIVELILRVCAWQVNIVIQKSSLVLQQQVESVQTFRQVQLQKNRRAWQILVRNLYPRIRRIVRKMRLKRCVKAMFCVLFVVRILRNHRNRSALLVRLFLRAVVKDRARALHQFQRAVHRAIDLVDNRFRCRKALRHAMDEQWMSMETALLLFQFSAFPDIAMLPGWKDEHAAVRLKLIHNANQLPPLEEDDAWASMPLYITRALKWRNFYRKYRPVGVFDETNNRLPRSLAMLRVPVEKRRAIIKAHLDAAYDFRRQQYLDASIAARKRQRNIEEWKERQRTETQIFVAQNYPVIHPASQLFRVVADYEFERRLADFNKVVVQSTTRSGTVHGANRQRNRLFLLEESDLQTMVVKALQDNIVQLKTAAAPPAPQSGGLSRVGSRVQLPKGGSEL